jgi:hypothetical protein
MLNVPAPEGERATPGEGRQPTRREDRVATVMLVARLISGRGDQLCRIRNLSGHGLKVNTTFPLSVDEEISIELRNGRFVEGKIVWSTPPFAGMQFHKPEDVEDLLSSATSAADAQVARLPRVQVNQSVLLHAGTRMLGATMIDLSQGGAKLRLRGGLEPGEQVSLSVTGLGSLKATVRWARNEAAGIAFHETIPFDTLSDWLSSRPS